MLSKRKTIPVTFVIVVFMMMFVNNIICYSAGEYPVFKDTLVWANPEDLAGNPTSTYTPTFTPDPRYGTPEYYKYTQDASDITSTSAVLKGYTQYRNWDADPSANEFGMWEKDNPDERRLIHSDAWTKTGNEIYYTVSYSATVKDLKPNTTYEYCAGSAPGGHNGYVMVFTTKPLLGDINADGEIDSIDYVLLKRYILEIEEAIPVDISTVDINADGEIDSIDAAIIKKYILGIITVL